MEVQTVSEAFVEWLQDNGYGVFGQNLFLGQVPQDAPDAVFWVITSGGSPIQKLPSGGAVKQYFISLYYRDDREVNIERTLFAIEELLNCSSCINLTGLQVYDVQSSQFPTDQDIDKEERRIGFLQANIKIYKNGC